MNMIPSHRRHTSTSSLANVALASICFFLVTSHQHVVAFPNQAGHCASGPVLGDLSEGLHGRNGGTSLLSDNLAVFLDGYVLNEAVPARAVVGVPYLITLTGTEFKGFLFRLSDKSGLSVDGAFNVSDPNVQYCPPCESFPGVAGVCHTNPTLKNEIAFDFTPQVASELLLEVTVVVNNTNAQSDDWYYSSYTIMASVDNKVDETDSPTVGPTTATPPARPTVHATVSPTARSTTTTPTARPATSEPTGNPATPPPSSVTPTLRPTTKVPITPMPSLLPTLRPMTKEPVAKPTPSPEVIASASISAEPTRLTEYIIVADLANRGGHDECLELRRGKTYHQNKFLGATCGRKKENKGQRFFIGFNDDQDEFILRPKNDINMCTEVYEAKNKAWLHIAPCYDDKSTQKWKFNIEFDTGDGYYAISPVDNDDFVLTNLGLTVDNGDPAMLKTYEDATKAGAIRKWRFEKVK